MTPSKGDLDNVLFGCGLLFLVERVHMAKTGASDPLSAEEVSAITSYLLNRFYEWKPSASSTTGYDSAVKALLREVLLEQGMLV